MSGRVGEITAGRDDVRLDAVALHLPEDFALEDWRRVGERLRDTQQSLMWWVGDWLRYGERKHSVTYAEAAELTGYKEQSLRTAVWLSGQFDVLMRNNKLTWHHHRLAASMPPSERAEALQRAADEGLSTRALKALIADMRQQKTPAPEPGRQGQIHAEARPAPVAAPAMELATSPEPPAPDPHKKLRAEYRAMTDDAQEEDWIALRVEITDANKRIARQRGEIADLKQAVHDLSNGSDLGAKLSAMLRELNAVKMKRDDALDAAKRMEYRLKLAEKRVKELEAMGIEI